MELLDGRDQGASRRLIAKVAKGRSHFGRSRTDRKSPQEVEEVADQSRGSLAQGL